VHLTMRPTRRRNAGGRRRPERRAAGSVAAIRPRPSPCSPPAGLVFPSDQRAVFLRAAAYSLKHTSRAPKGSNADPHFPRNVRSGDARSHCRCANGAGVSPVPAQMWAGVSPVLAQMWAGASPVPAQMWAGVSPVPAQMWAVVSPVPAQYWQGLVRSRRRCGRGARPVPLPTWEGVSPGADVVRLRAFIRTAHHVVLGPVGRLATPR
jgi:hypothetical protein